MYPALQTQDASIYQSHQSALIRNTKSIISFYSVTRSGYHFACPLLQWSHTCTHLECMLYSVENWPAIRTCKKAVMLYQAEEEKRNTI